MITQTRFKTVIVGLGLGLIEGLAKVCMPSFPIVETYGFQGAIVGAYLAARTVSGVKKITSEEVCVEKTNDKNGD